MDLGPLVPIVAILSGLGWGYLGYKKRELAHKYDLARHDADEQRGEKDRLKERVAVLEQIVTDRGVETANQIEALRKPRLTGEERK
jgi:hypothetical protein